jgi:hypothetical protein
VSAWECGSWHDSILVNERAYDLKDLPGLLKLQQKDLTPHRCAQVDFDLYLFVYEEAGHKSEIYCYFNSNFEIISSEKRSIG